MALSADPEKREKQIANLQPGNNGKQGRPKGSRNWATVTREILDDPLLFDKLLGSMERKPAWLKDANPRTLMDAITIAQSLKALGGSHFSAEWVRKTGFGDKIDITSNGETIKMEPVIVSNIRSRNAIEGEVVTPTAIPDQADPNLESTTDAV